MEINIPLEFGICSLPWISLFIYAGPGYVHIQGRDAAVEQSVSTKAQALDMDTLAGHGPAKVSISNSNAWALAETPCSTAAARPWIWKYIQGSHVSVLTYLMSRNNDPPGKSAFRAGFPLYSDTEYQENNPSGRPSGGRHSMKTVEESEFVHLGDLGRPSL
jgi:hypothetical protein